MERNERVNPFKKPLYTLLSMIMIVLTLTASTCDDDDEDDDDSNGADVEAVENALQDGTWRITYFFDDTDETSDFSGYSFTFNDDGTLAAMAGATTVNGTWSVGTDDDETKLNLNLGTASPWDELEDDWDVVEHTGTKIVLEDESGGSGEIDYLTLEKN
jgi:hypothetical protein